MQSDWHRYNLKRRVASLPPLSSETFAEKVLSNKASAEATAAKASFEKVCDACQKIYYSENAYQNHLGSQRHKINALRPRKSQRADDEINSIVSSSFSLGEPIQHGSNAAEVIDDEDIPGIVHGMQRASLAASQDDMSSSGQDRDSKLAANVNMASKTNTLTQDRSLLQKCLFCNYISPTLLLSISHMQKYHGMFIPEQDYLIDMEGLILYLHKKINEFNQCLYCGRTKGNASAVQTHMRDVQHCKIAYFSDEEMLEIGDFYDFRPSYSDGEGFVDEDSDEEIQAGNGVKLGAKRETHVEISGSGNYEDNDDWESDSTLSSVPTEEITSVPIDDHSHRYKVLHLHRHHSHSDPRPHHNLDGWHSHAHHTPHAVYHDDFELHLPTGRTAGHRSLAKYYRQNLHRYPTTEERQSRQAITNEVTSSDGENGEQRGRDSQAVSRANGGLGMLGVSDSKRREARAMENRERKRVHRTQNRLQLANQQRANFQKHFRDPLLQ